MFSRSDYVMRLVKQLAEALARVLKLRKAGEKAAAQQAARDACGDLLGIEFSVLQMLDARSAAELLGDVHRVDAYAQLLEALGDEARAAEVRQHALR